MPKVRSVRLPQMQMGHTLKGIFLLFQLFDADLAAYSLAGWADSILSDAIKRLLVGMEAERLELLTKSDQWIALALQRFAAGEPTPDTLEGHYLDLALGCWLAGALAVPQT